MCTIVLAYNFYALTLKVTFALSNLVSFKVVNFKDDSIFTIEAQRVLSPDCPLTTMLYFLYFPQIAPQLLLNHDSIFK